MSKFEKLIQKIMEEKDITFDEARKVLLFFGYVERAPRSGSSHTTFTKAPHNVVTLVKTQKPLKKYQIRLVKEAIINE